LFYSIISASEQVIDIRTIGIPPYGIEEQGELSGIYYELANLIVTNAGYDSNNKIAPMHALLNRLNMVVPTSALCFVTQN
jgi:polar amino acid transport system substrate-binding protein